MKTSQEFLPNNWPWKTAKKINRFFRIALVGGILLVLGLDGCYLGANRPPELIKNSIVVIYPPEARVKKIEGRVEVSILVDKSGHVKQAQIAKTSGYPILDNAALQIAQLARFKPARLHGKKQAVWVVWPLVFKIKRQKLDPKAWQEEVERLKQHIRESKGAQRQQLIEDLFFRYKDFAEYLVDHPQKNYNRQIQAVVEKSTRRRWNRFWKVYSAPFALFDDFVTQFPDHPFVPEAKVYLEQYLEYAINDLKSGTAQFTGSRQLRDELIAQLQAYLTTVKTQ